MKGLSIIIPEKETIPKLVQQIQDHEKTKIRYNTPILSAHEVDIIVSALNQRTAIINKFNLEGAFPSVHENHLENLKKIFSASITKVKELKLGFNSLPLEFKDYLRANQNKGIHVDLTNVDWIPIKPIEAKTKPHLSSIVQHEEKQDEKNKAKKRKSPEPEDKDAATQLPLSPLSPKRQKT